MEAVTHFFGWSGREITLGVLDDEAVQAFTDGDCHAFAVALHRLVGGTIFSVVEYPDAELELTSHYVVQVGADRYADVEGVTDEATLIERWTRTLDPPIPVGLRDRGAPYMNHQDTADIAAAATIASIIAERHLQPAVC